MDTIKRYDFVIVGSGAGGATLAKELCQDGRQVLVIERGKLFEKELGHHLKAVGFYKPDFPLKSKEGIIIWRTFMAGGSTNVSIGNGMRAAGKMLAEYGIDLGAEFAEAEEELAIQNSGLLVSGEAKKIQAAGKESGYEFKAAPKFIKPDKCQRCGECMVGCKFGAKWSAVDYLRQAQKNGAEVLYNTKVKKVVIKNGKAVGVIAAQKNKEMEIAANTVIIAAGGLETPQILRRSGIKNAGENLFLDLFINTYGREKSRKLYAGTPMSIYYQSDAGFIISPYGYKKSPFMRFMESGLKGLSLKSAGLMSIMTKIADDNIGGILPDGKISKTVTGNDAKKLNAGYEISKELLLKAGAGEKSIIRTNIQGAHPGGTAAIGKVVNKDLQTEADNLFICDASIFPAALGMPPILTIVALAKRLSKALILC
ncbi:MAG: GMC family oxidoreductase [Clostridiales bacterium]|nr:GMC family oxidoreductase [Clostridiales bacterium]